jgi:hypothetical protein
VDFLFDASAAFSYCLGVWVAKEALKAVNAIKALKGWFPSKTSIASTSSTASIAFSASTASFSLSHSPPFSLSAFQTLRLSATGYVFLLPDYILRFRSGLESSLK